MKRSPRTEQKLALRKDTVRALNRLDLAEVAGGEPTSTLRPSKVECLARATMSC
jgi:hypothetical protein